jgi:hypothetical protein
MQHFFFFRPVRTFLLALFLFTNFSIQLHAQYRTTKTIKKDYYSNGCTVQRVIKTRTRRDADVDMHHYYKRTIQDVAEFYENGNLKSQLRKIHNSGNSGRPYRDVLKDERLYDDRGVIRVRTITKNDGRIVIRKEYNQYGKLVFQNKVWRKDGGNEMNTSNRALADKPEVNKGQLAVGK